MTKTLPLALIFTLFSSSLILAQTKLPGSASQSRLIVGYLAQFRLDTYPIKQIETRGAADKLTHILYAFANVGNARPSSDDEETDYLRAYNARESVDGKADDPAATHTLRGAFNQLLKLKVRHPQLKVLISLGGANPANSKGFSLASRTAAARQKFVAACLDLFIRGNLPHGVSAKGVFDGIDVDWEYPTDCSAGVKAGAEGCVPEDTANFTLLLAEFRRQLGEQGKKEIGRASCRERV